MQKKLMLLLGMIAIMGITISQAMAHSTIYTDDIGRMHFLGKDNGAKTLQKVEDYTNPEQMDVTNATLSGQQVKQNSEVNETKVNDTRTIDSNASQKSNKTKGSFTSTKGSMDASNPYIYGGTNIENRKIEDNPAQKHFWRIW